MRRILVGYDGSGASNRALDRACELTRLYGCQLTVLTAAADRLFDDNGVLVPALDDELGRRTVAQGVQRACRQGVSNVDARTSLEAADDALALAAREGFDLVVVGHRGHGGFKEMLLGSTAKSVVDRAPCSVLVVR
ncbi:MAG: universal stress protein [Actinomycetota bacterium]